MKKKEVVYDAVYNENDNEKKVVNDMENSFANADGEIL